MAARLASLAGDRGSVTVHLDPPELGKVVVRFVRRGDRLHVQVRADRPEVAALLGQESSRLEHACARQGNPVQVQVEVAGGDARPQGDPSRGAGGGRKDAPGRRAGGREAAAPVPAAGTRSPGRPAGPSLLDVVG